MMLSTSLKKLGTALALSGALGACSMIPAYERPAAPTPAAWPTGDAYGAAATDMDARPLGWEAFFRAPELQELIRVALDNNRDLRAAALRVEAYRAQYRIQRSDRFPSVNVDGSGTRQRLPADLSMNGETSTSSQYSVGLGVAAYELDFFGRVRSLEQTALEAYLAQEASQRALRLSLTADVATAWLNLRTDQAQLGLVRDTLKAYEGSLYLIQRRFDAGAASELEVRQARSAVDAARAQEAQFLRRVAQDANGLQVLLGAPVPRTEAGEGVPGTDLLADLPVGLPAEVLQRRPDILAAEHRLRSANANIGAARAAFFPSISLTAAAGTASSELSGLFDGGSGFWTFMPQIRLPIFNAGRLAASLDYAELQKDIAVADYEKAIQVAFREVSDGLAARQTFTSQLKAEQDLVDTNRRYLELADQRYRAGVESYLTVLDAQRTLLGARQQQLGSRLAQLSSEIALYKALGGGDWR
ncbi:MAG: efflux transporter outer membrane subunit [Aromatoleum sp.]|jgi:multidrug efflux system outer membrane protein|uniref:efflux transporter outer membrane subunit n=1 Tax=Aromatoleum sp. TaxID=2307007 RepID=UPI002894C54E|nr:efflux transporter outer membrane subunit [Aromatoleum sp.]MDT3671045.1 efflux transporter outer membrane subunit [Aromatoleum sp.]